MGITLREFIEKNGKALGDKIEKVLTPVYNPLKTDSVVETYTHKIKTLQRKPYPVQEEIIKGLAKAIYHERRERLFLCGEMGTGKTSLGLSVIAMSPKPLRSLIVCPGHLVQKWMREATLTLPDVKVYDLAVKNVITILDALRSEPKEPATHEIWVVSKERIKLSYSWRAAFCETVKSKLPICPDCGEKPTGKDGEVLTKNTITKKRSHCHCGSSLWQSSQKLRRYSPAEYIKKYLRNRFQMVILDEIHEYKAGDSLQGHAMGQLAASSQYFMGLTGTLNGGFADNLFYLLYRLEPQRLKEFGYTGVLQWQRTYGTIEEIQNLEDEDHKYGRVKRKNVIVKKRPGVSPEVIGKYFLDKSCFIRLSDVIDGLPPYDETVVTISMIGTQKREYKKLNEKFREAVRKYRMKASSSMLQSLLSYPDSCVVFPEETEIKAKSEEDKTYRVLARIEAPKIETNTLLPKEKELLAIVKSEKSENRKVLLYLTFTGTRDMRSRIKNVLEESGIQAGILPETIEPKKREKWIKENADHFEVLITNPELVKVGLDLIQFPTIVFFQAGYNIFTLRQAARRSWRLGQKDAVKVIFLTYKDTMQELAISLIAKKLETSLLVEGDLPEGLAKYHIESGSLFEEMTKALVEERKYTGAETAWANFRKKEVETSLGIGKKETIFTEKSNKSVSCTMPITKTTLTENTMVSVTVVEGRKKRAASLSVRYGDLDRIFTNKTVQFALF